MAIKQESDKQKKLVIQVNSNIEDNCNALQEELMDILDQINQVYVDIDFTVIEEGFSKSLKKFDEIVTTNVADQRFLANCDDIFKEFTKMIKTFFNNFLEKLKERYNTTLDILSENFHVISTKYGHNTEFDSKSEGEQSHENHVSDKGIIVCDCGCVTCEREKSELAQDLKGFKVRVKVLENDIRALKIKCNNGDIIPSSPSMQDTKYETVAFLTEKEGSQIKNFSHQNGHNLYQTQLAMTTGNSQGPSPSPSPTESKLGEKDKIEESIEINFLNLKLEQYKAELQKLLQQNRLLNAKLEENTNTDGEKDYIQKYNHLVDDFNAKEEQLFALKNEVEDLKACLDDSKHETKSAIESMLKIRNLNCITKEEIKDLNDVVKSQKKEIQRMKNFLRKVVEEKEVAERAEKEAIERLNSYKEEMIKYVEEINELTETNTNIISIFESKEFNSYLESIFDFLKSKISIKTDSMNIEKEIKTSFQTCYQQEIEILANKNFSNRLKEFSYSFNPFIETYNCECLGKIEEKISKTLLKILDIETKVQVSYNNISGLRAKKRDQKLFNIELESKNSFLMETLKEEVKKSEALSDLLETVKNKSEDLSTEIEKVKIEREELVIENSRLKHLSNRISEEALEKEALLKNATNLENELKKTIEVEKDDKRKLEEELIYKGEKLDSSLKEIDMLSFKLGEMYEKVKILETVKESKISELSSEVEFLTKQCNTLTITINGKTQKEDIDKESVYLVKSTWEMERNELALKLKEEEMKRNELEESLKCLEDKSLNYAETKDKLNMASLKVNELQAVIDNMRSKEDQYKLEVEKLNNDIADLKKVIVSTKQQLKDIDRIGLLSSQSNSLIENDDEQEEMDEMSDLLLKLKEQIRNAKKIKDLYTNQLDPLGKEDKNTQRFTEIGDLLNTLISYLNEHGINEVTSIDLRQVTQEEAYEEKISPRISHLRSFASTTKDDVAFNLVLSSIENLLGLVNTCTDTIRNLLEENNSLKLSPSPFTEHFEKDGTNSKKLMTVTYYNHKFLLFLKDSNLTWKEEVYCEPLKTEEAVQIKSSTDELFQKRDNENGKQELKLDLGKIINLNKPEFNSEINLNTKEHIVPKVSVDYNVYEYLEINANEYTDNIALLSDLTRKNLSLEAKVEDLERHVVLLEELTEVTNTHKDDQINEINNYNQKSIEEIQNKFESEISIIIENHKQELDTLTEQYHRTIDELDHHNQNLEKKLTKVQEEYNASFSELNKYKDDFCKLKEQFLDSKEQYEKDSESSSMENKKLKEKIEELINELRLINKELMEHKKSSQIQIQKIKEEYEKEIETLLLRTKQEAVEQENIQNLQLEHEKEVKSLKTHFNKEFNQLNESYSREIANLKESNKKYIAKKEGEVLTYIKTLEQDVELLKKKNLEGKKEKVEILEGINHIISENEAKINHLVAENSRNREKAESLLNEKSKTIKELNFKIEGLREENKINFKKLAEMIVNLTLLLRENDINLSEIKESIQKEAKHLSQSNWTEIFSLLTNCLEPDLSLYIKDTNDKIKELVTRSKVADELFEKILKSVNVYVEKYHTHALNNLKVDNIQDFSEVLTILFKSLEKRLQDATDNYNSFKMLMLDYKKQIEVKDSEIATLTEKITELKRERLNDSHLNEIDLKNKFLTDVIANKINYTVVKKVEFESSNWLLMRSQNNSNLVWINAKEVSLEDYAINIDTSVKTLVTVSDRSENEIEILTAENRSLNQELLSAKEKFGIKERNMQGKVNELEVENLKLLNEVHSLRDEIKRLNTITNVEKDKEVIPKKKYDMLMNLLKDEKEKNAKLENSIVSNKSSPNKSFNNSLYYSNNNSGSGNDSGILHTSHNLQKKNLNLSAMAITEPNDQNNLRIEYSSTISKMEENESHLIDQLTQLKEELKATRKERDMWKVKKQQELNSGDEVKTTIKQAFSKLVEEITWNDKNKDIIMIIMRVLGYSQEQINEYLKEKYTKKKSSVFGGLFK